MSISIPMRFLCLVLLSVAAFAAHEHCHDGACAGHEESPQIQAEILPPAKDWTDYLMALLAGATVPLISFLGMLACRHFNVGVSAFLPILVSFGAGTMIASSTITFIPEAAAHLSDKALIGWPILIGIVFSVVMEHLVHALGGHDHGHVHDDLKVDVEIGFGGKMQAMAWNMLIGDAIHNAIDGVLIGTTFVSSGVVSGWIATSLIILHELPQEIAELCILLHAGWSMHRAICRNAASTLTIMIGVGVGMTLAQQFAFVETYCIAFIAGEFLYLALGQLLPSLAKTKMTKWQTFGAHGAFALGIAFVATFTIMFPHNHGSSGACDHAH